MPAIARGVFVSPKSTLGGASLCLFILCFPGTQYFANFLGAE